MKGEFISIETTQIMADMEKENKELQQRIDKAIGYVKRVCENENNINPYTLHAPTLLNILEDKDE